ALHAAISRQLTDSRNGLRDGGWRRHRDRFHAAARRRVERGSHRDRQAGPGPDANGDRAALRLWIGGAVGDRASMVMTWGPSNQQPPAPSDPDRALEVTEDFWRRWSSLCHYDGEWSGAVMRSLVTLKSLTYHPTGGIVAAPTTSLPEQLAGSRNWDYRFCWLRDATLTLLALMNAGYYHEAGAWREWLLRACAGAPDQVQIMYGLSGERMLREWEISWLPGYENAKPVRCGNAAHEQIQHDIFGEVMDA